MSGAVWSNVPAVIISALWDVPSSSAVQKLCFQCNSCRSDPWSRNQNLTSCIAWLHYKKKKTKPALCHKGAILAINDHLQEVPVIWQYIKKKKPFEVNLFRPWVKISQLIVARKLNRTLLWILLTLCLFKNWGYNCNSVSSLEIKNTSDSATLLHGGEADTSYLPSTFAEVISVWRLCKFLPSAFLKHLVSEPFSFEFPL